MDENKDLTPEFEEEEEFDNIVELTDEDGVCASASVSLPLTPANDAARAEAGLKDSLGKLGGTMFVPTAITLQLSQPWFVPNAIINGLRREAGISGGLAERGVSAGSVPDLAEHAIRDSCIYTNPRRASQSDLRIIYAEAL